MGEIEGWPGGRDERRERAMGEAALTLAELGGFRFYSTLLLDLYYTTSSLSLSPSLSPANPPPPPPHLTDLLLSPPPPTTLEEQDDDPEFLLPIQSLTAISALVPAVEHSRERVVEEMEGMVQRGLSELVRFFLLPHLYP